jgi:hypothetical protein
MQISYAYEIQEKYEKKIPTVGKGRDDLRHAVHVRAVGFDADFETNIFTSIFICI